MSRVTTGVCTSKGWENVAKQPAKGQETAKSTSAQAATPAESSAAKGPMIDAIPAEVHAKPADAAKTAAATSVPKVDKALAAAIAPNTQKAPKPDAAKPAEKAPDEKPAAPAPAAKPAEKPAPAPAASAGPGFFPLLLGGLLAGVIGFAVASLTAPATDTALADQVATQQSTIATLEDRLDLAAAPDLSGIEAAQATITADLDALEGQLAALSDQVADLAARPAGSGGTVTVDSSDVQAEMDALRAQIAEMTGAAQAELEEARAAAAAIEENAASAARDAAAQAALARVQTALESGAPIGAALGDLEAALGGPAPDALIAVQDGVPTLAALQDGFPDVARAALATARSEGVSGEETTGFGAFIRNQFDVRSTTPQDGDSTDAILSRAEAAMRGGRLSDALAEISALPEVARAEMSDWLAQAETRADAIAAVDMLSTSLSDN